MRNRSRKKSDYQQIARRILDTVAPDAEPPKMKKKTAKKKDPAAVALGRKGGLKGGHARAARLTKAELSESARKAARARWNKESSS